MKSAFFQVGRRVINRYEVRDVYVHDADSVTGYSQATVTYKDGEKVKIVGTRVPMFVQWILDKEPQINKSSWSPQRIWDWER